MATNDRDQVNGAGAPEGAGPGLGDAEDYEPYLPPGPNPFSSVHPHGAPPFERVPWSGSSVDEGTYEAHEGHEAIGDREVLEVAGSSEVSEREVTSEGLGEQGPVPPAANTKFMGSAAPRSTSRHRVNA